MLPAWGLVMDGAARAVGLVMWCGRLVVFHMEWLGPQPGWLLLWPGEGWQWAVMQCTPDPLLPSTLGVCLPPKGVGGFHPGRRWCMEWLGGCDSLRW